MKSLNNRGWGTIEMLVLSGALLLVLLFVAISIYNLYHTQFPTSHQYNNLEETIRDEAKKYVKDNGSQSVITLKELKQGGYITNFTDSDSMSCDGYVLISFGGYAPYISCSNYETPGFDQNYLR